MKRTMAACEWRCAELHAEVSGWWLRPRCARRVWLAAAPAQCSLCVSRGSNGSNGSVSDVLSVWLNEVSSSGLRRDSVHGLGFACQIGWHCWCTAQIINAADVCFLINPSNRSSFHRVNGSSVKLHMSGRACGWNNG